MHYLAPRFQINLVRLAYIKRLKCVLYQYTDNSLQCCDEVFATIIPINKAEKSPSTGKLYKKKLIKI